MIDPVQLAALQLANLQVDLDKLDRAISSGVLTVDSHTQGRITYRTMNEMLTARAFLITKINGLTMTTPTRRVVVTSRSGF